MSKEKDPLDDLVDDKNIPASNWFKFATVGDTAKGILVGVQDKPGKDVFGPQRVFTLKQADDTLLYVGIPLDKDYVIGRANTAKMGDAIAFKFNKEIPPSKKGFAPAKSIEVYVKHLEQPASSLDDIKGKDDM